MTLRPRRFGRPSAPAPRSLRPLGQPRELVPETWHDVVPPPRSQRLPRLIAVAVAVSGLATLFSVATAHLGGRLAELADVPIPVREDAASVAAVAGLGQLVVAGALARRQRRAWWVAFVLLLVAGVGHIFKDVDVATAGISFGLAAVLVSVRRDFDARPSPASRARALVVPPALAASAWVLGILLILVHGRGILPHPSLGRAAVAAARGAVGLPLGVRVVGSTGRWIEWALPLSGVVVVVGSLVVVFRPVVEGLRRDPSEQAAARRLVERYGRDTLAYFALRDDKNHHIVGEAMVTYRYLWNMALVSGDPIGSAEDVPRAMASFLGYARDVGWGVAVLAGGPDLAGLYASLGLRAFYLGDEAILDPTRFSLEGRAIRKVRQSCHRLERTGYSLDFHRDEDVSPDLQDALAAITKSWRKRAPERGFTMSLGREPSPLDPGCLTVVARDPHRRAQGYLHLVPCFGSDAGYSLDRMRRRPDTPNGLTEWMIARTALALGGRGVRRFSLNFAFMGALLRTGHRLTPLQRLESAFVRRLDPFFQIERLHDFNAKFSPSWYPRYIYYEIPLSLPRVALAYLEAEAFLRLPFVGATTPRRGEE